MVEPPSRAAVVVRLAKVVEQVLDNLGVTVNQYRALTLIQEGAPPMREFAVRLAMQQPNVSTLIDGLAGRGLVARQPDSHDGRRIRLSLTARGRTLLQQAEIRTNDALARVAAFDNERSTGLLKGIDAWQVALDRLADDLRTTLVSRTGRSA
jgi:DNA-binding MarR family transcriptional regulator